MLIKSKDAMNEATTLTLSAMQNSYKTEKPYDKTTSSQTRDLLSAAALPKTNSDSEEEDYFLYTKSWLFLLFFFFKKI